MSLYLDIFNVDTESKVELPLYLDGISCGVPSPSYESLENKIDINEKLIRNPSHTFYAKVNGQSMIDEGIDDGDLLVIDRSLPPEDNKIAVCCIDGDFTCKRIRVKEDGVWLVPGNTSFKAIRIEEHNQFMVWGLVTYVIKSFK